MSLKRQPISTILPAIIISLPFAATSDAYLDPGTSGMIIQMVIAGLVGGLFAVKIFWNRIKAFFTNLVSKGTK